MTDSGVITLPPLIVTIGGSPSEVVEVADRLAGLLPGYVSEADIYKARAADADGDVGFSGAHFGAVTSPDGLIVVRFVRRGAFQMVVGQQAMDMDSLQYIVLDDVLDFLGKYIERVTGRQWIRPGARKVKGRLKQRSMFEPE